MDTQNIGLKDIIGLAMKGYKVTDIKELIGLAKELPEGGVSQLDTDGHGKPEDKPEEPKSSDDVKEDDPENTSDPDELKKEIATLKEQIKNMQSENINKEHQNKTKSSKEQFEDFVKDFIEGGKRT